VGALSNLYARYRRDVEFLVVYVREAHPEGGWVLAENRRERIAVPDPTTIGERSEVAVACAARLELEIPFVIDRLGDETARRYGGWPDRLYLIGRDGRIAYQGGVGPAGFRVDELEKAIEVELAIAR
jgi:hypothetical protein